MGRIRKLGSAGILCVIVLISLAGCPNPMLARLKELVSMGAGAGTPSLYAAGNYSNGNIPCCWVNGVKKDLPLPASATRGGANSIAVAGGTIYIAGGYAIGMTSGYPCYWVNGVEHELALPAGGTGGTATSIAISNGTIYIAGNFSTVSTSGPCYWVNGTPYTLPLPAGGTGGRAVSICVSGGNIYFGGQYSNSSSVLTFCYWINGVQHDLTLPGGDNTGGGQGALTSIAFSDNVLYCAGYCISGTNYTGCYWVNGSGYNLPRSGASDGKAFSIAVSGGSTYIVGYTGSPYTSYSWVDGVLAALPLPPGGSSGLAYSVFVTGGAVYAAGQYYMGTAARACVWVNGVLQDLPGSGGAWANSVVYQ